LDALLNNIDDIMDIATLIGSAVLSTLISSLVAMKIARNTDNSINSRFDSEQDSIDSRFSAEQINLNTRLNNEHTRIDNRVDKIETEASKRAELDRTYERKIVLREKYEEIGELYLSLLPLVADCPNLTFDEQRDNHRIVFQILNKMKVYTILYAGKLTINTEELVTAYSKLNKDLTNISIIPSDKTLFEIHGTEKTSELITEYKKAKEKWSEMYSDTSKEFI